MSVIDADQWLREGPLNDETAPQVLRQLRALLGDGPFATFSGGMRVESPRVLRLRCNDAEASVWTDVSVGALLLHLEGGDDHTDSSLCIDLGESAQFAFARGQFELRVSRGGPLSRPLVMLPLRAPRLLDEESEDSRQAWRQQFEGLSVDLRTDTADEHGATLWRLMVGRSAFYAHPGPYGRLDRLRKLSIRGVWIGEGREAHLFVASSENSVPVCQVFPLRGDSDAQRQTHLSAALDGNVRITCGDELVNDDHVYRLMG